VEKGRSSVVSAGVARQEKGRSGVAIPPGGGELCSNLHGGGVKEWVVVMRSIGGCVREEEGGMPFFDP
jgi:hypothetical protein